MLTGFYKASAASIRAYGIYIDRQALVDELFIAIKLKHRGYALA